MLIWINKRLRSEEGFTLIELMVVVLIIAILIAIAIPTFLGARRRAQRKQAQSSLRNVLTHERTYYTDSQTYTEDGGSGGPLVEIDPNFTYNAGGTTTAASDDPKNVSIDVGNSSQSLGLAAWSKSKDCYFIIDNASPFTGNVPLAAGTFFYKVENGANNTCTASVTAASASPAAGSPTTW